MWDGMPANRGVLLENMKIVKAEKRLYLCELAIEAKQKVRASRRPDTRQLKDALRQRARRWMKWNSKLHTATAVCTTNDNSFFRSLLDEDSIKTACKILL
jgi:hypothetical protein